MASHAPRADLVAQVDDAIAKGATVHLGGEVADGRGAYYPATVLSGVDPTMRAYREELFGPVAVLYGSTLAYQLRVRLVSILPSRAPLICRSERRVVQRPRAPKF